MRITASFTVSDIERFKGELLLWAQQFDEVVWLDCNGQHSEYGSFDALLAVDGLTSISTDHERAFKDLREYRTAVKDCIFGYLSYDLKNDVEQLSSTNPDRLNFLDLYFFQPKKIIRITGTTIDFVYLKMAEDEIEQDFDMISNGSFHKVDSSQNSTDIRIKLRIFKDEYFQQVNSILKHIQRGDIYEANFCQEFYAENTIINPRGGFLTEGSWTIRYG